MPAEWVTDHAGPALFPGGDSGRVGGGSVCERASAIQVVRESGGAIFHTTQYPLGAAEMVRMVGGAKSPTSTMDWFCPVLCAVFGAHALIQLSTVLTCDVLFLPPKTFRSPHLPVTKTAGFVLNECTKPILIESGLHRGRQRVTFRRVQRATAGLPRFLSRQPIRHRKRSTPQPVAPLPVWDLTLSYCAREGDSGAVGSE